MEFLKEWTLCVCISLVCAVILSLFAPQGRMNRFYRMLISLFVFASFLYPLHDRQLPSFHTENILPAADEEQGNLRYELLVNRQITGVLHEHGVTGANVSSDADYDSDSGEIRLIAVEIAVPDSYSTAEVQALLLDTLGINARVIHIGE